MLEGQARFGRLKAVLTEAADVWRFSPLVHGLQVLRGVRRVVAAALVAEVNGLTQFQSPTQLMA